LRRVEDRVARVLGEVGVGRLARERRDRGLRVLVDPRAAELDRAASLGGGGEDLAADLASETSGLTYAVPRLEHDHALAGVVQPPRGGEAGQAGADDDHVCVGLEHGYQVSVRVVLGGWCQVRLGVSCAHFILLIALDIAC
jgi:hypothetical protein